MARYCEQGGGALGEKLQRIYLLVQELPAFQERLFN